MIGSAAPTGAAAGMVSDATRTADAKTRAIRPRRGSGIRSLLLGGPSAARIGGTVAQRWLQRKRWPAPCAVACSDHPGRGRIGLEEDRAIDPEAGDLRRG